MRISEPGANNSRPSYITPLSGILVGVVVGALFGTGITLVVTPDTPAEQCANVVATADNIIKNYEETAEAYVRLRDVIIATNSVTLARQAQSDIDKLNAQRIGYVDYYNQQKGVCE